MGKEQPNLEQEAIRELSERYFACKRILHDWSLPECKRIWFERQMKQAEQGLANFGIDEIIAIKDGEEKTEVVIFDGSEK